MSELMMKYFAEDDTIVMSSDSKRRLVAQDYEAILLCVRQAIADEREACAKIADRRAVISTDAAEMYQKGLDRGEDIPDSFPATERCASLEASHIANLIRNRSKAD